MKRRFSTAEQRVRLYFFLITKRTKTMIGVEHLIITFVTLAFPPFILFVLALVFFSFFGWKLGVRERYVEILLQIFEWGRQKIEIEKSSRSSGSNSSDDEDTDAAQSGGAEIACNSFSTTTTNGLHATRKPSSLLIHKKTFCEAPTSIPDSKSGSDAAGMFQPDDIADYLRWGMEAIIEDEVTKRFTAAELSSWNMLTRTNQQYHFLSIRLTILFACGFLFRYVVLLPLRITIFMIATLWLAIATAFVGYIPDRSNDGNSIKRRMCRYVTLMWYRMCARSFSATVKYHDTHNRPRENAICVANHTSPVDVVLLASDNSYGVIAQIHGGFFGFLQRAQARGGSEDIYFQRGEATDREAVSRKLKSHINSAHAAPILIFPEGTCVNNTSVMMFKKGSFELDCDVYPVAIKYDQRFGDTFWDSSKHSFFAHLCHIMTSWALVADVMYLPPMRIREDENSAQFANRVKKEIAKRGGFVDLDWDGGLKRASPKAEWKQAQQKLFSARLTSVSP